MNSFWLVDIKGGKQNNPEHIWNSLLITRTSCEIKFFHSLLLIVHIMAIKKSPLSSFCMPTNEEYYDMLRLADAHMVAAPCIFQYPILFILSKFTKISKLVLGSHCWKLLITTSLDQLAWVPARFKKASGILMKLQRMEKLWCHSLVASQRSLQAGWPGETE